MSLSVAAIQDEFNKINATLQANQSEIIKKFNEVDTQLKGLADMKVQMELTTTKMRLLENELEALKRSNIRRNIVVTGIKENGINETRTQALEQVTKLWSAIGAGDSIEMERVTRLGKPRPTGNPRPILIELARMQDKFKILTCTKNMAKHPEFKGVYINWDKTKLEIAKEKALRAYALKEKEANKEIKFRIRNGTLEMSWNGQSKSFRITNGIIAAI